MNFFEELEGRSGEGLAVSTLRMLMLRSPGCRNAVIRVFDAASPVGRIESRSHFSCYTEHPTKDPDLGNGRIDLLVEVDTVVVGVDAKFGAALQADQPAKYQGEVQRLAEVRGHTLRWFLVVLVPDSRRREIEGLLTPNARIVTWEEIIEGLGGATGLDPVSEVLRDEYVEFLRARLDFLPGFETWYYHLKRWEPRGTEEQHRLLRSVWSVLPTPSRLGSGDTWVGYYFSPGGPEDPQSWIGFVPGERAGRGPAEALLVLAPAAVPEELPRTCRPVKLTPEISFHGSYKPSFEILFEPTWGSQEQWRDVIEAFTR